ncbi:hypothetical protein OEZ85_010384 [Tetradesmus obliquus]|uniref:Exportin-1/Importin-beta-like domain-containing protein n=1 Tax=Tetradesmus obliquus TaxID=3088 RepID=A0ABY8TM69_TETOB|nr:hypothetical protein OEZ85_010384 [Tetradesmus obliquus]
MLLSKVRADWHKLSAEQQSHIGTVISNKFQLFVSQAQAKLALQRLGLLLAAVASLSGPQACATFAGQCVGMLSGGEGVQHHMSECALSMLTALAEEVNNMDRGRRRDLVSATSSQWGDIAGLARGFIPEQMAAGYYGLVHGALLCLQGWLRMSADASSSCRMSPGQLAASHPTLLSCLFSLLGATAAEAVTAERIEGLACEILCDVLGPGTYGEDSQQERTAVDAAVAALLSLRDVALTPGPAGAGVARCVASIASALAQRDTSLVCGGAAAAATANGTSSSNGGAAPAASLNVLPLAELLLHCVSRPERAVCEAAVEYFVCANTLPLEQRHPQMGGPLYASLLGPLLGWHSCYSSSFVSWNEELDEDEEAFYRFRDQSLTDLLETVFLMTGPAYLQQLQERIAAAAAWQQAEGALFCLKAVADMLRGQVASPSHPHAQQNSELLRALFEDLCSPSGRSAAFLSNPYTCATAAALVGAYAPWFESTPAAPLEGALRLLLHALCFEHSWHAAARAFKVLCMRCAARLCSAPVVQSLAAVAASAIAPAPLAGQVASYVAMPLEDRQAIVEGLARVVTFLGPQDVNDSALNIQQPHLARTQSIISHGSSTAAQGGAAAKQLLQHLADELQLMAVLIKGMEFPGQPPPAFVHPAMKLLEAAWPVLSAVADAPVCRQDRPVLEAVCEVHKRALQAARGSAKPLLPTLLTAVGELFTATQQPACLDVLSTISEVFGEVKNAPELAAAQKQSFEGAVAAASAVLMQRSAASQSLSASGDLLRSLLAVADAHLVFARELFVTSSVLPQEQLTGESGRQWLLAALQSQQLPGMSAGLLKPADCEAFAKLALRQPPLSRGRFDALLMDFAAIPRGEGSSDALLAYEL